MVALAPFIIYLIFRTGWYSHVHCTFIRADAYLLVMGTLRSVSESDDDDEDGDVKRSLRAEAGLKRIN